MKPEQIAFRAALARIGLGVYALTLLPAMYPGLARYRAVVGVYLACVAGIQVMIRKNLGGEYRAFLGGIVDLAMLTFLVHRCGTHGTVLVALYLFAGTMNALVATPRVAFALASIGGLSYATVAIIESLHVLPYAPDAPAALATVAPDLYYTVNMSAVVVVLTVFSTGVVVHLMRAVRQHETELTMANERLEQLSQEDALTHLYNRRYVFTRIEAEISQVSRGRPLTVVMLDLDGFKRVNDEHGHLRGDALLKEIANALARTSRSSDVAGRYGGDEFIVVLTNTDAERAKPVAERFANAVREVGLRFDSKRPVTASVGIAEATANEAVASVLRRADENAYRAKQSGGNRVAA